jgi:hypothetical protein
VPAPARREPRLTALFNEARWSTDVQRLGARGRQLAEATRHRLERDGVALPELHRCQAEGPEGTQLAGCVKLYLDDWRLVFVGAATRDGRPALLCIALGLGHPPADSTAPSAYRIAHRRLHGRS